MDRDEFRRGWIWKAVAIVVTILLVGALAVFWWSESRAEQTMQDANAEMEQELRPLELERHRLQQELDDVKAEYNQNTQGTGSLVLLFTNLDEQIYTEIYPMMEAYGYAGVMTLSEDCFPGAEGCMSREQFRELIDAGWECCLRWGEEETNGWVAACGRLAREAGIARPKAVYFPADTYDSEKNDFLIKKEFLTAVYHGEGEVSLISYGIGGDIWNPGAMGWEQKGASKLLDEIVEKKGNLIFTIGTDFSEEEYEKDSFIAMLEKTDVYRKVDDLKVMTLTEAREYRQGLDEGREGLTETYNEQRADLEAQLEELEQKIDEITRKYGEIQR